MNTKRFFYRPFRLVCACLVLLSLTLLAAQVPHQQTLFPAARAATHTKPNVKTPTPTPTPTPANVAAGTFQEVAPVIIAGGGGRQAGGRFVLTGAIGQVGLGATRKKQFSLDSGFWPSEGTSTGACSALTFAPAELPDAVVGQPYSQTVTVTPSGTYSFTLVDGSLLVGLSLNPQTGVISGIPTAKDNVKFTVKATASNGCTGLQTYKLKTKMAALAALGITGESSGSNDEWLSAGQNLHNTRYQEKENKINPSNVAGLVPAWSFTTGADVSATPALEDGVLYVPDWAGNLYAINQTTGTLRWSRRVPDYTGVATDFSRTTPALAGDKLILGDQGGRFGGGAWVFAVNKQNGNLVWKTQVEPFFAAIITQSPIAYDNTVYVGVSSAEEALTGLIPGYPCCQFRGSVLALDAKTGQIKWRTYMVPTGFSGGAVWGSTPVVDEKRRSLYITTGNNYSVPQAVSDCVTAAGNDPTAIKACNPPQNYIDSILSLDLKTGAVKWATAAMPFDAWNVDCNPFVGDGDTCPQPSGPDFDFGQGPMLFSVKAEEGRDRELVGAGQKSGQFWALNPDTGAVVWVTQVGPGGFGGGLQWGSATDGKRIYVADSNSEKKPWNLVQNGLPTSTTTNASFWSALDAATGKILWQTPNPTSSFAPGAVSVANGVMYAGSFDPLGQMYAINAATGNILWSFTSGGSVNSGPALANGMVFWGSGYGQFGPPNTPNNKLYAFRLP